MLSIVSDEVSSMVVLVVKTALTADKYIAFHLLDMSQLTAEVGADILAHSSEKDGIAAVEMREVPRICSSVNASPARRLLL